MHVLVTGGAGFIGANLVRELLATDGIFHVGLGETVAWLKTLPGYLPSTDVHT